MTYTTPEDLSTLTTEQTPSTFDKAKTLYQEGLERSQRIHKILRAAFTQTAAEFKEGRKALSPLAKEVTTETVTTVREKSQQAAEVLNDAWAQEASSQDLTERIVGFLQRVAQSAKVHLLPQVKTQAIKLDDLLIDRYGDRYASIREKFAILGKWYATPEQSETSTHEADATPEEAIVIEIDSEVVN